MHTLRIVIALIALASTFTACGSTASTRPATTANAELMATPPTSAAPPGVPVIRQRAAYIPATSDPGAPDAGTSAAPARGPDSVAQIDDAATWSALASQPSREITARTETVKIVIDLDDSNRVYFLDTRHWEIHYYFIQRFLARPGRPIAETQAFWQREYLSNDRHFIQAAIVHYRDQNIWAFELIAQDVLDTARAIDAFRRVRERFYLRAELRYHPIPPSHIAATDAIRAQGIPIVTHDEIFANTHFQPLNPGQAYGYLRFFDGPVDPTRVRPFDIVVLAQVPLDLPVCAGVITAELQTPLSHIAVLSANRRTPNMALRGATHDAPLRALEGQLVRLHVTPQEYTVTPTTQAEAERAWAASRPPTEFHPRRSDRDVGLPSVTTLRNADLETVGAKASQLGELTRIRPAVRLPRAFAVPFHAYIAHLRTHALEADLNRMLADPAFQSDSATRERALAAFRARIIATPVDPALLRAIRAQINALFPGTRVRYRSSTNAEDLPGFNGAGLYLSDASGANPSERQIADALRRVWASTWSFQGYEERAYFRIVQTEVAMSVMVQESIDDDHAAGVAITGNPFDEGRPGYFINAQLSAGSVTSAATGEVPEQLIFYTFPLPGALERISSSSRTGGRPVLSEAEAIALSRVLFQIHAHFTNERQVWQTGHAMDVEFLIAGPDRHVVIVQARPFTIHWDEGRGYARPPS